MRTVQNRCSDKVYAAYTVGEQMLALEYINMPEEQKLLSKQQRVVQYTEIINPGFPEK